MINPSPPLRLLAVIVLLAACVEAGAWAVSNQYRGDSAGPRVCLNCDPLVGMLAREQGLADGSRGAGEVCLEATAPERVGSVAGRVTFSGDSPLRSVADQGGRRPPLLEIDANTRGLRYAVVYWKPPRERREPRDAGLPKKPAPPRATIDQKEYEFVPRVVAIQAGDGVKFTNSDVANHNVHGFGLDSKNQFNVFTGGGGGHTQRFRVEKGDRPVRIGCDIHPWMGAWVYVFDHASFAVTNAQGEFRLDGLPPGRHMIAVRQPDGGLKRDIEVEIPPEGEATLPIEFTPADLDLESR